MIRKSLPSGDDPMGGYRFSLATNGKRLRGDYAQLISPFVLLALRFGGSNDVSTDYDRASGPARRRPRRGVLHRLAALGSSPHPEGLRRGLCVRGSGRGLREGVELNTVQMERRQENLGRGPELGQARQGQRGRKLHAGRRRRVLRLRSGQAQGRYRLELPRTGVT